MLSFPPSVRIHIALGATDMRKSFDGLSGVVQDVLGEDPLSGHVFAFCNRRRTILKMLVWDRSGYFLFAKRLEQGTYAWPEHEQDAGNDFGQMVPMLEQIEGRLGERPKAVLVDGGFAGIEAIEEASRRGTTVYAPVMTSKGPRAPYEPRPGDSAAIARWRQRMGTPPAQAIYRERAATAECVNAIARHRGLVRLFVRGLKKVRAVLLWFALAHNLLRAAQLRAAQAA